MNEILRALFKEGGLLPHGHCYQWTPEIVWLHVVSDALIVLAYYSIPITLVYFVRQRRDLHFSWMFVCFAVFILACGTTHLLEIWNVWHSNYWLSGGMKALTALASLPTAMLLVRLVPTALALAGPGQLQRVNAALEEEIQTRRQAEERVRELNAHLENRVAERTAELNMSNGELVRQMSQRKMADERFRLVVEASPNAIVLANASGRILLVNSATERLFGYAREELMGQPVEKLVPARFREAHPGYRAGYTKHAETRPMGQGRDLFALRKDGSEVPVEIGLSPIQTAEGPLILSAIVDITERQQAEEAVRASELDFRASFYSSAVGQAQVEPETGQYLRVNPKFCEIAGYAEEELLGMTFHDLTHPDDRKDDDSAHGRMIRGETSEVSREKRYLRKDGKAVWVGINASLIRDETGRPLRTLAVVQDISARKEAEEAQRTAEEKFRCLVEQSLVGIYVIQGDRFVYVNPKMAEIFGFTAEELTSAPVLDFITEEDRPLARENIRKRLEGAVEKIRYGLRMLKKDGGVIHVEVHGGRAEYNGQPAILGTLLDTTERKRAEDAMRESQQLLQAIIDNSTAVVYVKDLAGRYLLVNRRYEQIFHFASEIILGRTDHDLFPKERADAFRAVDQRVIAAGTVQEMEEVAPQDDGPHTYISIKCPLFDAAGKPYAVCGISTDITERKQTEEVVRESNARKTAILESALDCIITADHRCRIIEFNPAAQRTFGRTHAEVVGKELAEVIIPPAYRERHRRGLAHYRATGEGPVLGKRIEVLAMRADGSEFPVELAINAIRVKDQPIFTAYLRDITERKQAEEAVRQSEARYRTLFDTLIEGFCTIEMIFDASGKPVDYRFLEINPAFEKQTGLHNAQGKLMRDLAPDHEAHWFEVYGKIALTGEPAQFENEAKALGRHYAVCAYRIGGPESRKVAILFNDITERKRAEEALRESEAQFHAADRRLAGIVQGMTEACFALDAEWRFTFVNDRGESLLHHRRDEMLGRPIWEVFRKLVGTPMEANYRRAMAERVPVSFEAFSPIAERWLDIRLFPSGEGLAAFLLDIHGRKLAEEEVHQLNAELEQRVTDRTAELEAANKELEAFSYSVSHDLRAPLRAVDGFSQALLEDYGPQLEGNGQRYLQTIRKGAQRMGMLIDDLLTFSRLSRVPLSKRVVDATKQVRETLDELSSQMEGRQIELQVGDLPVCSGDPALLKQVWVNLLSNALKYTRKRQAAVVEVGCILQQDECIYFVRDNGTGFDMRYADKLFGVFQRLHRADEYEGTGVGLAIVQRVIHRHGGRIWAEAAVDRGATFYFTLEGEPEL